MWLGVKLTNSTQNSELIRELESLLKDHSLYQEAKSKPYCGKSELLFLTADEFN